MANCDIGYLAKEDFMKLLPDRVPVRKSAKATAKFPLYCHTPLLGPVSVNTRGGQEVILENAVLFSPDSPAPKPEIEPEVLPEDPETEITPAEPEAEGTLGFVGFIKELGAIDD